MVVCSVPGLLSRTCQSLRGGRMIFQKIWRSVHAWPLVTGIDYRCASLSNDDGVAERLGASKKDMFSRRATYSLSA